MPLRGRGRGKGRGSLNGLGGKEGMEGHDDALNVYHNFPGSEGKRASYGSLSPLPRLQLAVVQPGENGALFTGRSNDMEDNTMNGRRTRGMRGGAGGVRSRGSMGVSAPQHYGQIVDSDMVHDEIREVGDLIKNVIKENFQRHGTEKNQVLAGIRQFGPSKQSKKILNKENEAARLAYEQGIYVVWRLMEEPRIRGATKDFCCRIGPRHRCFCGHMRLKHASPSMGSKKGPHSSQVTQRHPCEECECKGFVYVPNEPEEIGEGWLTRRTNWDPSKWSAKCRCGHGHKDHHPATRICRACGGCSGFQSHFLCVVCDMPWEAHQTVYETESERHKAGFPVRQDYFPLSDIDWDIREMVLKDVTGGGALQAPNDHDIHEATEEELNEKTKPSRSSLLIAGKPKRRGKLPSVTRDAGQHGTRTNFSEEAPIQGAASYSTAEYCPSCATIYKVGDTDSCGRCGRIRPGKR